MLTKEQPTFYLDRIHFKSYDYWPASVCSKPDVPASDIQEVWLSERGILLSTGEVLFVPYASVAALDLFSRVNHLVRVRRTPVWSYINEPFLDTEFTSQRAAHTRQQLEQCGFTEKEISSLRSRLEKAMLNYNSMLWEWIDLDQEDALRAMRSRVFGRKAYRDFYWESMAVARRGRVEESTPSRWERTVESIRESLGHQWPDTLVDFKSAKERLKALQNYEAMSSTMDRSRAVWEKIADAYAQPHRAYHNLFHLHHMLAVAESISDEKSWPAVELACYFHDVVYEPSAAKDNEVKSAEWMRELLTPLDVPKNVIALVERLILSTQHHLQAKTREEKIIADADLSILAEEDSVYDAYVQNVRREYQSIDAERFRKGRRDFLEKVLSHQQKAGKLFHSLHPLHEVQARRNMERELTSLK